MAINIILLSIAFAALAAGTIADIKKREVPDWLNYGLVFMGLGLRLLFSASTFDWSYIIEGIAGLAACVVLGYAAFYAGLWGGGDSKMLMGLGALLGIQFSLEPVPLLAVLLVNIIIAGSVYGLIYGGVLAIARRKRFAENFREILYSKKMMKFRRAKLVLMILFIALFFILIAGRIENPFYLYILTALAILAYLGFYLFVFSKAVENTAMLKLIEPEKITEGDWIAKDVFAGGKRIAGPKDLGISIKQIKTLIALKKKGKIKKVLVKYGIPFVPSFLIAFVLSLSFGAWWAVFF